MEAAKLSFFPSGEGCIGFFAIETIVVQGTEEFQGPDRSCGMSTITSGFKYKPGNSFVCHFTCA